MLASTDRVQKTHLEIRMTHHNAAVALKSGGREAFGEGVGDHKVGTQRHELNYTGLTDIAIQARLSS